MADPATARLDPIIRPATEDDVAGDRRASRWPRRGFGGAAAPPGLRAAHIRQALQRGTVHVAQIDGAIVGFGSTVDTGRALHLADLFVDRDVPGSRASAAGCSRGLFGDRWPRTTFASDDPRAMPLYIRAGMSPLWPNVYVTADERFLPEVAPGFDCRAGHRRADRGDREPSGPASTARPTTRSGVIETGRSRSSCVALEPSVAIVQARRRIRGEGRWIDRMRRRADCRSARDGTRRHALRGRAGPGGRGLHSGTQPGPAARSSGPGSGSSTATRSWRASPTSSIRSGRSSIRERRS